MNKLTIAIPTYNRSVELLNNVKNLLTIIDDDTTIVISDNCSTDNTFELINRINDQRILYHKNSENLGYDKNVLKVYEIANSEYVWFMSDDDSIDPELYRKVVAEIEEGVKAILIDAYVFDPNTNEIKIRSLSGMEDDKKMTADEGFLIRNLKWSTLISSIIVKKDNLGPCIESTVGTLFVQLPLFWNLIKDKEISLINSSKIKKNIAEVNYFSNSVAVVWLWNLNNALQSLEYEKDATHKAHKNIFSNNPFSKSGIPAHFLLSKLATNKKRNDLYKILNLNMAEKILIYLVDILPLGLFRMMKKIRNKI